MVNHKSTVSKIVFLKKDFIYSFLERGEGREKERERNRLDACHMPQRHSTHCATPARENYIYVLKMIYLWLLSAISSEVFFGERMANNYQQADCQVSKVTDLGRPRKNEKSPGSGKL